jgi:hypothetical protein
VGLCAGLGLIAYVVLDKKMRMLGLYAYRSWTRFLTGQFVEIDPIGILNTYVSRLKERLEEMDTSIGNLRGQRDNLKKTIEKNEADRIHNLKLAQQAQKHVEMKQELALRGRQAGRLQKSNMTLQNLFDRIEVLLHTMQKMREASALLCEDIQGEVEVKTAERKALLAGYNAFTKARTILEGGGSEKELFDMTMEKLTDDYAAKMGEIEGFLDLSKSVINGMDLDNGIFEEDALNQLKAWETKGSTLLSNPPPGMNGNAKVRVEVPGSAYAGNAEETPTDNFSELFNGNDNDTQAKQ